ncbi:MAG: hypothetical protein QOG85_811 [Gaiellaceae bacterium]|jgi:hypothetical protein|nr:hypothetical protein [Gaiellaceae bacterium]
MSLHRRGTFVFGLLSVGLGLALIVRTATAGGSSIGSLGYLLGALFVTLGVGRLYLLRRGT